MPLATLSGPLSAVSGSSLVLDTRTNLDTGAAFSGAGKLVATGGDTVRVVGSASATNLEQQAGTLDGGGTLTISGLYAFQGATMGGTGATVILPGATLKAGVAGLAGATNVVQRTIDNQGTILVEGLSSLGLSSGATLLNSGLVDLPGDRGFGNPGSPGGTTQNSGTIRKSGGAGESLVRGIVHNLAGGSVEVQTGRLRFGDGGSTDGHGRRRGRLVSHLRQLRARASLLRASFTGGGSWRSAPAGSCNRTRTSWSRDSTWAASTRARAISP
jgi:hypothetical protein